MNKCSYLITFPNLFERAKFEETKEYYFHITVNGLINESFKSYSNRFIEIPQRIFSIYVFLSIFPNCKVVKKYIKGKKVHYECINKG